MELRTLGSTGIEVSALGLGTVKFGRNQGMNYPEAYALPQMTALASLLAQAREYGINLLDTAPAYGHSEKRLGRLLRGQRRHWVLASKVGEAFAHGVSRFDFGRVATRQSVQRSLRRLNTDWLDLVQIHSNGEDERILREEEVLDELRRLRDEGWIRSIGMSTKTVPGGLMAVDAVDVVMLTYNPADTDDGEVIDYAYRLHKGVLIKKGLAGGHLNRIESEYAVTRATRFVLSKTGIASMVIGTINPAHLRENVRLANEVSTQK